MIYPWQQETWLRLTSDLDRLHHALLLNGPAGGGKADFALAFAARLMCETATDAAEACGECPACNWFAAGNHPDFRLVVPDSESGEASVEEESAESATKEKKLSDQIRVDQIRELASFLSVATHRQGRRIVLIRPAEAMNVATANSLLKLLEEPAAGTLFLLVTNNLTRLLPTIRSRCRLVHFPKPPQDMALTWLRQQEPKEGGDTLAFAGGMPLAARDQINLEDRRKRFLNAIANPEQSNPLTLAAEWEGWLKPPKGSEALRLELPALVDWLQKWVYDLILVRMGAPVQFHPQLAQRLTALARQPGVPALFACYNDLLRAKAVARHPLNTRLYLEDMLLRYARLFGQ